jgi:hypothetical protein
MILILENSSALVLILQAQFNALKIRFGTFLVILHDLHGVSFEQIKKINSISKEFS